MTLYEMVTSTILTSLRQGVVPWRKPWHVQPHLPTSLATGKPYRGVNVFLLGLTPFTDHRWLTFRQAQKLGGTVKKGEKATLVVFWKRWQPPEQDQDGAGPKRQIPLLRCYRVFNAQQCEGLDLAPVHQPPELRPEQRIERARSLIELMPDPPTISEGGRAAWYRPSDDHVQLPPFHTFESPDAYYATLFHELGHSTGHAKRLNRPAVAGDVVFGSGEYSREELVAELTSAYCCATISLDHSLVQNSASYIANWLKVLKEDPKALVVAAAQAQHAADHIRGVSYDAE